MHCDEGEPAATPGDRPERGPGERERLARVRRDAERLLDLRDGEAVRAANGAPRLGDARRRAAGRAFAPSRTRLQQRSPSGAPKRKRR